MVKSTVTYDANTMKQVMLILEHLPISGSANVKAMGLVFDVLKNPIPEHTEDKTTQE